MVHVWLVVGWVSTNWVALGVGGYLGYKFGDTVKGYAVKVLGKLL